MSINLADHGYNDVPAFSPGEFTKLPAGGYVCRIINAELANSKAGNLMLVLFIDIAEGDFLGYFKAASDKARNFDINKKWDNSGVYRQLIFDSQGRVSPFFKGLISSIEQSNHNFRININDFDPASLRGLLCGFVFAAEEYPKRDDSIAERVVIKFPKFAEDIRNGNFKIPDTKKLEKTTSTTPATNDIFGGEPVNAYDVPF